MTPSDKHLGCLDEPTDPEFLECARLVYRQFKPQLARAAEKLNNDLNYRASDFPLDEVLKHLGHTTDIETATDEDNLMRCSEAVELLILVMLSRCMNQQAVVDLHNVTLEEDENGLNRSPDEV